MCELQLVTVCGLLPLLGPPQTGLPTQSPKFHPYTQLASSHIFFAPTSLSSMSTQVCAGHLCGVCVVVPTVPVYFTPDHGGWGVSGGGKPNPPQSSCELHD